MPASTPTLELPYPTGSDPADAPADLQALAERMEELLARVEPLVSDTADPDPGQLIVANGSAIPTYRTLSGDATVDVNGALTIGSSKVTTAKLAANAVTAAKIADGEVTGPKLANGAATSSKLDISRFEDVQSGGNLSADGVIPGISITPGAGTYCVMAHATLVNQAAANSTGKIAIRINGVNEPFGPIAQMPTNFSAAPLIVMDLVTVAVGQAVEVYADVSGTVSVQDGHLQLIRLA